MKFAALAPPVHNHIKQTNHTARKEAAAANICSHTGRKAQELLRLQPRGRPDYYTRLAWHPKSRRHYRIIPTQEPSPRNAWRATPWLKAQMNHPMTGRRILCLCKLYGLPQKCVCGDCSPLSLCEQAPIGKHSETERMQTTPTTTAWPMRRTKAGGTAYKQK